MKFHRMYLKWHFGDETFSFKETPTLKHKPTWYPSWGDTSLDSQI